MASRIIGLTGRKRSGKDTFAAYLVAHHGYKRFAFADNVRQAALDLDPIVWAVPDADDPNDVIETRLSDVVRAEGWERAKEEPEVRRTLQRFGSESIRRLDPDFWVRAVMVAVRNYPGPAVITDVRFPNELEAVHNADGVSVRITRPGLPSDDLHISETALDDATVNFVYSNRATIEALHAKADECARLVAEMYPD